MKHYLAIGLLLVSTSSVAIECGPSMRTVLIAQLKESVKEANGNLTRHSAALLGEQQRMFSAAKSDADYAALGKVDLEYNKVLGAYNSGDQLEQQLSNAWTLALIRDDMVHARDKALVSAHLSFELYRTKQNAEIHSKFINDTLTVITRPGVAVDIAKLRDAIDVVMKNLAICTSPLQPAGK